MLLVLRYVIVNPMNNYTIVLSPNLVMPFKLEYSGSNRLTVLSIGAKTGLAIEGGSQDSEKEEHVLLQVILRCNPRHCWVISSCQFGGRANHLFLSDSSASP